MTIDEREIEEVIRIERARAVAEERAAVVAWLREEAMMWCDYCSDASVQRCADIIERGEHRRKEEK